MTDATELDTTAIRARLEAAHGRCGYAVTDADGNEEPCDRPSTGWRWYQDVGDHEDLLDEACDIHANEGGRLLRSLLEALDEARAEVERLHFDLDREAHARQAAERSRSALIDTVKRLQDQIARAAMEPGQDRQKAMHAYAARAESAESALAAVQALADEWQETYERWSDNGQQATRTEIHRVHANRLRAALATPTTTEETPVLDGPSFGDYWPPIETATECACDPDDPCACPATPTTPDAATEGDRA